MTPGPLVVDASVVVENLVRLEHAASAMRLFVRANEQEQDLWAPDLIYPETLSALRKLVQRRVISAREGNRAAGWLSRLPLVTTGTGGAVREMWRLRASMTPCDAAYAVLALRLRAPLVTADEHLARAFRRAGGRPIALREFDA
jgi:predicted nucleic acid-binding protein